jgi:hypothetical protein
VEAFVLKETPPQEQSAVRSAQGAEKYDHVYLKYLVINLYIA